MKCSGCGADLPPDAPSGHCVQCLIQLGLGVASGEPAGDDHGASGSPPAERPGDRIGRYKLLEQIGEGGCGSVYMAEQEEPVRRRVALKIIKLGMDTRRVVARFEAERQALALMHHPCIAQIYDAGATPTGRPYFVMELVVGVPITEYCDQKRFSTEQRQRLFIQVCQAVQHAHQKGVIHRDIKPSNILVTERDGLALPKVIDFGIAKATGQQQLTDKTLFTAFEQFLGTPAYMSPEQAGLGKLDVDTRSDIYALGVLLYELLTGQPLFDVRELRKAAVDEVLRIIREKEPAKPSTRLTSLDREQLSRLAERRQSNPEKLPQQLQGDLDWIVMKALEKERTRRYETANGLAMDLERCLKSEPVLARPPSRLYQFQKLVRRNRLLFAAAGALAASLILGFGLSTWLLFQERQERRHAVAAERESKTEALKSKHVASFLEEMLKGVRPAVAMGRDTTLLREILDKTALEMSTNLVSEPEVEFEIGRVLIQCYGALGSYDAMLQAAQTNLALANDRLPPNSEFAASAHALLGRALLNRGHFAAAEPELHKAIKVREALFGQEDLERARILRDLAFSLLQQTKTSEAEGTYREALAIQSRLLGPNDRGVLTTMALLGQALRNEGKYAEAERVGREALSATRKTMPEDSFDLRFAMGILASTLMERGKLSEAEELTLNILTIDRKTLGEAHPDLVYDLHTLGRIQTQEGKLSEAEKICSEELQLAKRRFGDHDTTIIAVIDHASVLWRQKKLEEAEAEFRQAVALGNKLPVETGGARNAKDQLARVLIEEKKLGEGELAVREALSCYRKLFEHDSQTITSWAYLLGTFLDCLGSQGKLAEAEKEVRGTLTPVIEKYPDLVNVRNARSEYYGATGRWREAADDMLLMPAHDTHDASSAMSLGAVLVELGEMEKYQQHCQQVLDTFKNTKDTLTAGCFAKDCLIAPTSPELIRAAAELADTGIKTAESDKAIAFFWFAKGLACYRQEQFSVASDWLRKVVARTNEPPELRAEAYMVLAMAEKKGGNAAASEQAFGAGTDLIKNVLPRPGTYLGYVWNDWLIAHILQREASELFPGQTARNQVQK